MAIRATILAALALVATAGGGPAAAATSADEARRAELVSLAAASADKVWPTIATDEPGPTLTSRLLFSAAFALCEADRDMDRLERLFALAEQMQDVDPASAGFGNFRWYWRDAGVTDLNAVEFCAYDMHLIWRLHRDRLSAAARESLRRMLGRAVDGCLRHRVKPTYTNIAILNAANLVVLGELLGRDAAAAEGYMRLEGMAADTWRFGLHEFCSPTYYSVDIQGLAIIERFAARPAGRALAASLLELVWTDVALNFLPAAQRLAGSTSRTYDFLRGLGGLQQDLRWEGWSDVKPQRSTEVLHVAQGRWAPPPRLRETAQNRLPRLVRQSWGPRPEQSRTHWLLADVSLGSSGAGYGPEDCPLACDFMGQPGSVRAYFLPDGREDPYAARKFGTGAALHPKAHHVTPFWTAAQREADALGLVVYRAADLTGPEVVNVQSHFVLPRDCDGLWLGGRPLAASLSPEGEPQRVSVAVGDPLVIRKGTAALGVRIVWSRAQDGGPAPAALVAGDSPQAVRLTVEHRRPESSAPAAAALWVRIGGGLATEELFTAWREAFERSHPDRIDISAERIDLAVPGVAGPVAIAVDAPIDSADGRVRLDPPPSRAVLELDGVDVGRHLLERSEPFTSYAAALAPERIVAVPRKGAVRIEAESGLVLPRMVVGDDGRGTRFIWQPAGPEPVAASGGASWRLRVPLAGRYRLWGRTIAPDATHDSFSVSIAVPGGEQSLAGAWHVRRSDDWNWAPVQIAESSDGPVIPLPEGDVTLTVVPREAGAKLDALWLTSDPRARPE